MKEQLPTITFNISRERLSNLSSFIERNAIFLLIYVLSLISVASFVIYYSNGLGLAYNDARSHLDIGRRVVEGLKPGLAQLGSVWLPLPHILMVPTIWSDFMWHSGLSGALVSMISFVGTGVLIYLFLKDLGVGLFGRFLGVFIFVVNMNILYLQATAMTELLLLATMTAGVYELMLWHKSDKILHLLKSSFWIMLSTLVRYDGWFLLFFAAALVALHTLRRRGYQVTEGMVILFCTMGGLGIFLWFIWNQLIFGDALYFIFGPFSARAQQIQLERAGDLPTKGNLLFALKIYFYAMVYNVGVFPLLLGFFGAVAFWFNKNIKKGVRIASSLLFAPVIFNVLALIMGHSVLFIQGISGDTWFNVRYGVMMVPSVAIFVGYLIHRAGPFRYLMVGLLLFVTFFSVATIDAVTIDDARVGASQKNVTEVSSWLRENTKDKEGFILISAASHDAIIFSSGLPMKKFIHEGTGAYWESATTTPDHWARWIVMRTYDDNDLTYKSVKKAPGFANYRLVDSYPFADIYELEPRYLDRLNTEPTLGKQK